MRLLYRNITVNVLGGLDFMFELVCHEQVATVVTKHCFKLSWTWIEHASRIYFIILSVTTTLIIEDVFLVAHGS